MIMLGLYIIKIAVDYVNRGQLSVIAFDQPLYALARLVQGIGKKTIEKSALSS